jgi:malate dehydrogenase (oxaloacetate-decarboxylating)
MHDDQHGTAIVTLAGLINAMKVTKRDLKDCRIVLVGAGAAGVACAKLIYEYAKPLILAVDSKGIISKERKDLNESKKLLLEFTNRDNASGSMEDAIRDADIFIGVSQGGLLTETMVKSMAKDPIIIAMANPIPEIMPDIARKAGASIVATGRSDFPNQINNALAFPGVFRGALDHRVRDITEKHKLAAAEAIAKLVEKPDAEHIMPDVFDERLVPAIAEIIT